jgi:hypothetical protein
MSDKVKADDLVPAMREAFVRGIRETLAGTPTAHALQLADRLCTVWREQLAGLLVDGGSPGRRIDGAAIRADWGDGKTLAEIMARHECSRATAYNHHPSRTTRRERRADEQEDASRARVEDQSLPRGDRTQA